MAHDISLLDDIRIASPCPVSWESMAGDERVRFCGQCSLHVYNLSGMERGEAEALVREREGRLCVAFYRRADGTVLTRDCPVGLRAARWAAAKMVGAVTVMLGLLIPLGSTLEGSKLAWTSRLREMQPFKLVRDRLRPDIDDIVLTTMPTRLGRYHDR